MSCYAIEIKAIDDAVAAYNAIAEINAAIAAADAVENAYYAALDAAHAVSWARDEDAADAAAWGEAFSVLEKADWAEAEAACV